MPSPLVAVALAAAIAVFYAYLLRGFGAWPVIGARAAFCDPIAQGLTAASAVLWTFVGVARTSTCAGNALPALLLGGGCVVALIVLRRCHRNLVAAEDPDLYR